jgi:hypothetical protein
MINKKSQQVFFEKVFGLEWSSKYIDSLIDHGVILNVSFIDIVATYKGQKYTCAFGVNTSGMMEYSGGKKSAMPDEMFSMAAKKIRTFINSLHNDIVKDGLKDLLSMPNVVNVGIGGASGHTQPMGGTGGGSAGGNEASWGAFGGGGGGGMPGTVEVSGGGGGTFASSTTMKAAASGFSGSGPATIKFVTDPKGVPGPQETSFAQYLQNPEQLDDAEKASKDALDSLSDSEYLPHGKIGKKPVKTSGVIKLRDAKALGQKVFGTSSGSIYTLIAHNSRVKIAARLANSAVSIRAEFNGADNAEKLALQKIGLAPKMQPDGHEYYSFHMSAGDVPVGRILGAFLLDVGVEFDEQIKNIKEVEKDEG